MASTVAKKGQRSDVKQEPWKGKAPNRGQWKTSVSAGGEDVVGFVTVSVKLRPEEKAEFKRVCEKLSVTPNRALRTMAREASGFLEVSDDTLEQLKLITRQISGVATNINQIAKAGNRTFNPDYVAFMEDRKQLGVELARLEQLIQMILNVGKRRSDGLRKLDETVSKS
ncbi:MAG: DNA mobilization endonuclease VirD1/MobC family subunit [Gammaproteobacteria bacterium]|nr:DNA mobilization endonuclease VirD1/MobC family subunit [Gammaproteobacteria bacterium]